MLIFTSTVMGERKIKISNSLFYIIQIFILIIVIQYLEYAHYQDLTPQSKYDHILYTSYNVNSSYYSLSYLLQVIWQGFRQKIFWRFLFE